MTQSIQAGFDFGSGFGKKMTVDFAGPTVTSDGGLLLLKQTEMKLNLLSRLALCFRDARDPTRVQHSVAELLSQRVFGLALGYEDLNDHDRLRHDPLLGAMAGKTDQQASLAGKSTLNRLELSTDEVTRYKKISCDTAAIDRLLVDVFLEAHSVAPAQIVLDLDSTDLPLYGHQEQRFFHGYYDEYCYLPLYMFAGEHLLCARLRPCNQDGATGCVEEVRAIVERIRQAWPTVRIIVRGDSGFCRDELLSWCESQAVPVDYVVGLARNSRLETMLVPWMEQARAIRAITEKPARAFAELRYQTLTGSWSRERRVVGKAEALCGKENPRYVVSSLAEKEWDARALYEDLYCARGEMENRIKEQLSLFADRVSAETMGANQLRVYLAGMAYVLISALRRIGLAGTEMARSQAVTIRSRLLKIGAQVKITVRRVWVHLSEAFPLQAVFWHAAARLRC